ncbi:MAG: magnesium transporter [Thermoleophilaceae bacterium]|nr:magnesium transporter [Thermoleophilaceae bacterium]
MPSARGVASLPVIVDYALYEDGVRHKDKIPFDGLGEACRGPKAFVWIGLLEPSEEEFDSVRREFHLHDLAVEDAIEAHQRPKLEVYGDTLFVVLKTACYIEPDDVEFGEILLFVGDSFIVTVRHGSATDLHALREELEGRPQLLEYGPVAVLHQIVDRVVDDYQPVINELDVDISEVEDAVFSPDENDLDGQRIYKLKREVLDFRRAAVPLLHPLDRLTSGRISMVPEKMQPYFRDVLDHLQRTVGQIDGYSELLTGVLEASLIQVQTRQSEEVKRQGDDVRKISAWAAIIAVPTAVAGIYGMNFKHMPELHYRYGYPIVLGFIAAVCLALYLRLRKSGWL